ncbi:MAG TPA: GNAT family N-acetyltransferase [Candidatus Aquicultor sp.]|jgi:hypothetical protein
MSDVVIRGIAPAELCETIELIRTSFNKFIAPGYTEEGIKMFFEFTDPEATLKRLSQNAFMLVAHCGNKIIGVIEVRD